MSNQTPNPNNPSQVDEAAAEGFESAKAPGRDAVQADRSQQALADMLDRWLQRAGADCTKVLGKAVTIAAGQVRTQESEELSAAVEGAAVACVARLLRRKEHMAAFLAGEEAALALARAMLDESDIAELDDTAVAAFGELARQIWGSLEGAWQAEGASDFVVEPQQPQRIEDLQEPLEAREGPNAVVSAVLEVDGEALDVIFLFPADLQEILEGHDEAPAEKVAPAGIPRELKRILRIKVPLVVEIAGRTSKVGGVMGLRPGSVVEFYKKSDEMLDLYAAHAHIGRGEAVKVGESFGIRVLEIDSIRDRVKNLGR